jgi:hypothetical protein
MELKDMGSFLLSIILIYVSIKALKKRHPSTVYTLWYLFFLMTGVGFGIYFYLDASGTIVIEPGKALLPSHEIKVVDDSLVTGGLLEKALKWFLEISTNAEDEIRFLAIVLGVVILPQILSFFFSGLFGCGRSPVAVFLVTKWVILSLAKFLCVLAALITAQLFFMLYKQSALFVITDLFVPFLILSNTFFITCAYFEVDTFYERYVKVYLPNRVLNILERVVKYMTKYGTPEPGSLFTSQDLESISAFALRSAAIITAQGLRIIASALDRDRSGPIMVAIHEELKQAQRSSSS